MVEDVEDVEDDDVCDGNHKFGLMVLTDTTKEHNDKQEPL